MLPWEEEVVGLQRLLVHIQPSTAVNTTLTRAPEALAQPQISVLMAAEERLQQKLNAAEKVLLETEKQRDEAVRKAGQLIEKEALMQQRLRDMKRERDSALFAKEKLRTDQQNYLEKHAGSEVLQMDLECTLRDMTVQHKILQGDVKDLRRVVEKMQGTARENQMHLRVAKEHQNWLLEELTRKDQAAEALKRSVKVLEKQNVTIAEQCANLTEGVLEVREKSRLVISMLSIEKESLKVELKESEEHKAVIEMQMQQQGNRLDEVEKQLKIARNWLTLGNKSAIQSSF